MFKGLDIRSPDKYIIYTETKTKKTFRKEGYYLSRNWPVHFKGELIQFFGGGNWECISSEEAESEDLSRYTRWTGRMPGSYKNWYISSANKDGDKKIYIPDLFTVISEPT